MNDQVFIPEVLCGNLLFLGSSSLLAFQKFSLWNSKHRVYSFRANSIVDFEEKILQIIEHLNAQIPCISIAEVNNYLLEKRTFPFRGNM